jgi:hypothetical protein
MEARNLGMPSQIIGEFWIKTVPLTKPRPMDNTGRGPALGRFTPLRTVHSSDTSRDLIAICWKSQPFGKHL